MRDELIATQYAQQMLGDKYEMDGPIYYELDKNDDGRRAGHAGRSRRRHRAVRRGEGAQQKGPALSE